MRSSRIVLGAAAGVALLAAAAVTVAVHLGGGGEVGDSGVAGRTATPGSPAVAAAGEPCPAYVGLGVLTACVDVRVSGPLTLTGRVRTYLPFSTDSPRARTCREYANGVPDNVGGRLIGFPNLLDPRVPYIAHDRQGRHYSPRAMDDLHGHRSLHGHYLLQLGSIFTYHGPGTYTTYGGPSIHLDDKFYRAGLARQRRATVNADGSGSLHIAGTPPVNVTPYTDTVSIAAGPKLDLDLSWTCTGQVPIPSGEAAHGRYRQR